MARYRPVERFNQLQRGTIIKHVRDERCFVVTANYGDRITAVASVDVTNRTEWEWFDDGLSLSEGASNVSQD